MKEEKKTSEVKSNVISGMSSTVGAAAGVVAGSVISSEVDAAEIPVTPEDQQEVEVVSSQPSNGSGSTIHHNPEPTPEPTPDPNPVPEPTPEPEIEVVSYETISDEDGSQMDVALINAQGQTVMIADVDQNGYADLMASDLNNNNQLDEGEIVDISDQNVEMQPLQDAANMGGNDMIVQANDVDYINDANVDEYMA